MNDIVEVLEVGQRRANALLKRGYRLLAVEQQARMQVFRADELMQWKSTPYVKKDLTYSLGRTAEQAPFVEAMAEVFADEDAWQRKRMERERAATEEAPVEVTA